MNLDVSSVIGYFAIGVGGGFILYVVFSLLGYGIGKLLRFIK